MSNSIDVNLLSKEVAKALTKYADDISEEVKEVANTVGKEAANKLKQISPKRSKKKLCERLETKTR